MMPCNWVDYAKTGSMLFYHIIHCRKPLREQSYLSDVRRSLEVSVLEIVAEGIREVKESLVRRGPRAKYRGGNFV